MSMPGAAPKKKKKNLGPIKCVACGRTLRRSAFNTAEQIKYNKGGSATCNACLRKRRQK